MEYALIVNEMFKFYKTTPVLKLLSINVPKGSIYGLVGKNGAGKTTLIRVVSGLQEPSKGDYSILGVSNNNTKELRKIRLKTGVMVDSPAVDLDLTARENLMVQYKIIGKPDYNGIDELLDSVGLDPACKKRVKTFSLGMRQRLGIAMALAGEPEFVILDEPANGIDPQGIIQIRELILKLNKENGVTFLISSHILDELARVSTHYGFIEDGRLVKQISADEINLAAKRTLRYKVSDINIFAEVADSLGVDYKIISDYEADVFGEIRLLDMAAALNEKGCEVLSAAENTKRLEDFYIDLLGGEKR